MSEHPDRAGYWLSETEVNALRKREYERGLNEALRAVEQYAVERLVKTQAPNMSEDITAALRVAASRINTFKEKP